MTTPSTNLVSVYQLQYFVVYTDRQEEDELVLQIVYVFYYLVLHQSTRRLVLSTSRILAIGVSGSQTE